MAVSTQQTLDWSWIRTEPVGADHRLVFQAVTPQGQTLTRAVTIKADGSAVLGPNGAALLPNPAAAPAMAGRIASHASDMETVATFLAAKGVLA